MAADDAERGAPVVSVVIPTYCEEMRIGATLGSVVGYLAAQPYSAEVIVADDGSTDRTAQVVLEASSGAVVPVRLMRRAQNRGKGYTVREGMLAARGARRLFSDADLSTPIDELGNLLRVMDNTGAGVVIGSRALPDSVLEVRQPWYRESMGRAFNRIVRCVGLTEFPDTQCGFKLFTADAAQRVFPLQTVERFGFDVEILWIARSLGIRVEQVPVRWIDSPQSRVSPVSDAGRMFLDVLRVRRNAWAGRYRVRPK